MGLDTMIEFTCKCGKQYKVKDELAGKRGKCKECGRPMVVPGATARTPVQKQAQNVPILPWNPSHMPAALLFALMIFALGLLFALLKTLLTALFFAKSGTVPDWLVGLLFLVIISPAIFLLVPWRKSIVVEFNCPCGIKYMLKKELAGRTMKCRKCGALLDVPLASSGVPWNPPATSGLKASATTAHSFAAVFFVFGLIGFFIYLPFVFKPELKHFLILAIYVLLLIVAFKAMSYLTWKYDLFAGKRVGGLKKKTENDNCQTFWVPGSRRFVGYCEVNFVDSHMRVRGRLGLKASHIIALFLATCTVAGVVMFFSGIPSTYAPIVGVLILLATKGTLLESNKKTIEIFPNNVASLTCRTGLVQLKLVSPVSGVKGIRILALSNFRTTFFQEFDRVFPNLLPEDYRNALKRIQP